MDQVIRPGGKVAVPDPLIVPDPGIAPYGQGSEPADASDSDAGEVGELLEGLPAAAVLAAAAGIAPPKIVAFRTRAQLGLVPPRLVSRNLTPNPGGVAAHYGGAPAPVASHATCETRWKAWQTMHMSAPRGWNDIAYTGGYCSHGYAFAGRGLGVRTAGQGTNDGNQRYYAVCWLNDRPQPTPEALSALSWWVVQLRAGGAGIEVWPHKHFHSTDCPGNLAPYTPAMNGNPIPGGTVVVDRVKAMTLGTQRAVHVAADGIWGPHTDAAVNAVRALRGGHPTVAVIRAAQAAVGTGVDGIWGPNSRIAHHRTVLALQGYWGLLVPGLGRDGIWGPKTDAAWTSCRTKARG